MKDLFLLDPAVVFLNHGSFGACPRPVFEAYQGFQRELEHQPVEFLALDRRFPALLDEARTHLAAYVGAAPENLAFATNASSALNAVIRSLDLRAGDEVLAHPMDEPPCERHRVALRTRSCRGALAIVDGAHAPGQIDLDLAALGADVYAGNCHKRQLH